MIEELKVIACLITLLSIYGNWETSASTGQEASIQIWSSTLGLVLYFKHPNLKTNRCMPLLMQMHNLTGNIERILYVGTENRQKTNKLNPKTLLGGCNVE